MFSTITGLFTDPLGTLQRLALTIPCIVIALTVHEFFHAYTADRLGDSLPRSQGRVTLNPAAHIDLWGMLSLFLVGFGWGRPVQVNERALRPRRWGSIAVSVAGPLSNLAMALIGGILYTLVLYLAMSNGVIATSVTGTIVNVALQLFALFMIYNANLFVFNLLPVPPLDGFRVCKMLFSSPRNLSMWWKFERYGFIVLFVLAIAGVFGYVISPISNWITDGILSGASSIMNLIFGAIG